ncbi:MAG TPA: DUF805 domain-containing protein [Candidatus Paceibacterota bacterium]
MQNYISVLKKYVVWSGRAGRREYWMFFLFSAIISMILAIISSIVGDDIGILGGIYGLAVLLPGIAVAVRILHDTGRSAWWILLCLIPIIGWVWLIVLYVQDSQVGDNKYGSNPKGV